jgi:hypothetical protein
VDQTQVINLRGLIKVPVSSQESKRSCIGSDAFYRCSQWWHLWIPVSRCTGNKRWWIWLEFGVHVACHTRCRTKTTKLWGSLTCEVWVTMSLIYTYVRCAHLFSPRAPWYWNSKVSSLTTSIEGVTTVVQFCFILSSIGSIQPEFISDANYYVYLGQLLKLW